MKELYAHSTNSQGQRHRLDNHLTEVARLAKKFADKFDAGDPVYYVGLWHDLGKYSFFMGMYYNLHDERRFL